MKTVPSKNAPVCRPMRQMSERVGEVPLPAPVPEPEPATWETGAATADPPPPPKRPARRGDKPKRQSLKRVSAEEGTMRSSGGDPTVKLISRATYEALLSKILAPKPFRQAAAYVHDWSREEPDELVIPSDRPVEVVRGRALAACAIPRTPESRWNLHALADMEALLDEAARQETAREIAEAWQEVATEEEFLAANRAMRTRNMKAKAFVRWRELESMA